jgi:hypothetical protein
MSIPLHRCVQTAGTRSTRQLNYVLWSQINVCCGHGTSFMSSFWHIQLWEGSRFLENLWTSVIRHVRCSINDYFNPHSIKKIATFTFQTRHSLFPTVIMLTSIIIATKISGITVRWYLMKFWYKLDYLDIYQKDEIRKQSNNTESTTYQYWM